MSARPVIAWVLQLLLAVLFIKSGFDKLRHLEGTVQFFGGIGLPSWMAYVVGGAELLGGIGLLVPQTVRPAAIGLILLMVGALVMHATKIPGGIGGGGFALVLLVGLAAVLVLRRPARRLV